MESSISKSLLPLSAMRWLWNEWNENPKSWVGLGNPCTLHDTELFATATKGNFVGVELRLFQKSVHQQFLEIVSLTLEDDVK